MLTPTINRKIRTAGKIEGAGRSLSMRRVWFADPAQAAGDGEQGKKADAEQDKDDADGEDDDALAKLSPKELAEMVREKRREAASWRTQLRTKEKSESELLKKQEDADKARKAAADKELEEQGKYKELYERQQSEVEQLKAKAARADTYDQRIKARNEERIGRIPESSRKLIPANYSPEQLEEWLDAAETTLLKPQPPNLDSGKKGEKKVTQDPKQTLKRLSF